MITIDYTNKTVGFDLSSCKNTDQYIDYDGFFRTDSDMFPYQRTHVWSIFDSFIYPEPNDSEPLEKAFEKKDGWKFRSDEDEQIIKRVISRIANHFTTRGYSDLTVYVLEDNAFNNYIVQALSYKAKDFCTITDIGHEYEKLNGRDFVIVGDAIRNEQIINDLIRRVDHLSTPESITIISQFFKLIRFTKEEALEWIKIYCNFPVKFNQEKDLLEIYDCKDRERVIATLPSNPLRIECREVYDILRDYDSQTHYDL